MNYELSLVRHFTKQIDRRLSSFDCLMTHSNHNGYP
jgi:hypothetical protein